MSSNVSRLSKEGKAQDQAVAIAYSVLKKACGVPKGREKMTPKEIVQFGKSEAVQEQAVPVDMNRANRIVQGIGIKMGAGVSMEMGPYDAKAGTLRVRIKLNQGFLDNLFDKALEANPSGWDDEAGMLDVDEDAVGNTYAQFIMEWVEMAATKIEDTPPFGKIVGVIEGEEIGDFSYVYGTVAVEGVTVAFGGPIEESVRTSLVAPRSWTSPRRWSSACTCSSVRPRCWPRPRWTRSTSRRPPRTPGTP